MIEASAAVRIDASPGTVWSYLEEFETLWEESNPDHDGTWVVMDPKKPLRDGLRFYQREFVGPVKGLIKADLRDVVTEERFSWIGTCTYTLPPIPFAFTVEEGGTMKLEGTDEQTRLSHRVWARIPPTVLGAVAETGLALFGDIEQEAYEHTLVELEYFKEVIEKDSE
ncbi:SRPBCC family protein [Haloarchaeobius baliensis]|uniref:SRPBCC family protein n=1 Tax=Haloarchaeobius baliensis TaxID=1670458 RepID=UPI003F8809B4